MLARYRYRIYPEPRQERMLVRTFGCARVVFNDSLRLRDEMHAAGEKITDTEVQRRVITLAKTTPERAWLREVASVALVQACQDARRAYANWFGSLSGRRKGRSGSRGLLTVSAASSRRQVPADQPVASCLGHDRSMGSPPASARRGSR